jgi:hypothetical protein
MPWAARRMPRKAPSSTRSTSDDTVPEPPVFVVSVMPHYPRRNLRRNGSAAGPGSVSSSTTVFSPAAETSLAGEPQKTAPRRDRHRKRTLQHERTKGCMPVGWEVIDSGAREAATAGSLSPSQQRRCQDPSAAITRRVCADSSATSLGWCNSDGVHAHSSARCGTARRLSSKRGWRFFSYSLFLRCFGAREPLQARNTSHSSGATAPGTRYCSARCHSHSRCLCRDGPTAGGQQRCLVARIGLRQRYSRQGTRSISRRVSPHVALGTVASAACSMADHANLPPPACRFTARDRSMSMGGWPGPSPVDREPRCSGQRGRTTRTRRSPAASAGRRACPRAVGAPEYDAQVLDEAKDVGVVARRHGSDRGMQSAVSNREPAGRDAWAPGFFRLISKRCKG